MTVQLTAILASLASIGCMSILLINAMSTLKLQSKLIKVLEGSFVELGDGVEESSEC